MKTYSSKPYEAFQHILIYKSCIDLNKFDLNLLKDLRTIYLLKVDKLNIPAALMQIYEFCELSFQYAKFVSQGGDVCENKLKLEVVQEEIDEGAGTPPYKDY